MTFANICNLSKIIGKLKLNLKWINLILYFIISSLMGHLSNVNLMEFEYLVNDLQWQIYLFSKLFNSENLYHRLLHNS